MRPNVIEEYRGHKVEATRWLDDMWATTVWDPDYNPVILPRADDRRWTAEDAIQHGKEQLDRLLGEES